MTVTDFWAVTVWAPDPVLEERIWAYPEEVRVEVIRIRDDFGEVHEGYGEVPNRDAFGKQQRERPPEKVPKPVRKVL